MTLQVWRFTSHKLEYFGRVPKRVLLDIQTEQEQKEFTPQDFLVNLQELGTYKFAFDTNLNTYAPQIAQKHMVAEGSMDLEDVKREGGEFVFSLPWDITLNSIAVVISANGKELIMEIQLF